MVIDWTIIGDAGQAKDVALRFREAPRSFWGRTSISAAIDYSVACLPAAPSSPLAALLTYRAMGTTTPADP